jgi:hypothetical protein
VKVIKTIVQEGAVQYTERIKTALSYAEESSKRARWIVFILQLAVVLVISSIWQQAEHNWVQKRLDAAQDLVRVLTCDPGAIYGENALHNSQKELPATVVLPSRIDAEYLDSRYYCSEITEEKQKIAARYHHDWGFSLPEAKKNVADLQQIMANRILGFTVPVLGIVFDIDDLSVISGFTFAILLSWFHFSLLRQHKNVRHVFDIARRADWSGKEPGNSLSATYYLLAMTQVLTIPPSTPKDLENPGFLIRISRLPSLIMWTAVIAQIIVVIDDCITMARGDNLNPFVSHFETSLAFLLLFYLIFRTYLCFKLMAETQDEWVAAYKDMRIPISARKGEAQVTQMGEDEAHGDSALHPTVG